MTMHRPRDHRRAALLDLGFLWFLVGFGVVLSHEAPRPGVPHEHLPIPIRFAFWVIPGLVAMTAAIYRPWDSWGWAALIVPILERLFSFGYAWFVSWWPWTDRVGYSEGWLAVLVYGAFGLLIKYCADGLDRPALSRGGNIRWIGN